MSREGDDLTAMERRMIRLIFEVGSLAGAARVVSVTYDAANGYVDSMQDKLGADDLPQLTVLAERKGLLEGVQPRPRRWKLYAQSGDDAARKSGYAPDKPKKSKKPKKKRPKQDE